MRSRRVSISPDVRFITHKRHPLFVKHIHARDVGSDVTTDRVTSAFGTMRVKFPTCISVDLIIIYQALPSVFVARTTYHANLGSIPETMNLDIRIGLDELGSKSATVLEPHETRVSHVGRLDGSIGDEPGWS